MGRPSKKPIPTEFLSLSEWMHQSTMFNVLTSMKFFKYYLIGKIFSLWKGNVRYRTYHRTRQELSKNLIQQRRDFLSCHMEINKILYDMQAKLTFTPYRSAGVIPLDTFNGVQVQHRASCRSTYNDKVDAIVTQQLSGLVKRVTEEQNLREEEDLENSQRGQAAKNKSMSS
jgi:dynein heavy chain